MNASAKRTIRLGLTVGLSLGAIVGIVGCAEQMDDTEGDTANVVSENGFVLNGYAINGYTTNGFTQNGYAMNGFTLNGFTQNGFANNGYAMNGFTMNGYAINGFTQNGFTNNGYALNGFTMNGLENPSGGLLSASGLMTTPGGREFVKYMVKVAYPNGAHLTKQDNAVPPNTYTFDGSLGVAPELEYNTCDLACQEKVSAAMLAHVNNSGLHVGIWLVGPDNGIGWATSPDYPYQEGAYFGNMFAPNPHGNYCAGANLGGGPAKGRLGAPLTSNANIMNSPYGSQWDGVNSQNVPSYCWTQQNQYCAPSGGGFSSCSDSSPQTPYSSPHTWTHVVTVFRNFEPTQLYKICNKSNKCLGVAGGSMTSGANVEQHSYTAALGQTWQILQVSPGNYKVVNRTSGMVLDLNGAQLVQRPFVAGTNSQIFPLTYMTSDMGRANLKTASTTNGALLMGQGANSSDALVQAVTGYPADSGSPDAARWAFYPIGLATFDPGRYNRLIPMNAQNKSIDVPYASTNNGTAIQIYDTWNGDPQKFIVADAGNGNVKFVMKLNTNKCLGPRANGTTSGTVIEVQDCNGSFNQAWMSSEQGAGSAVFAYRNSAAPALCLDVLNWGTNNGAAIDMYTCNGGQNQQFKVLAQ
ncbi:MAG TPA: RICIN domain-containing protein [Polyangia bacterium]|jgi:hypothetical protein|nr:RICIN domain-containing protein [Polyangia bacterium]